MVFALFVFVTSVIWILGLVYKIGWISSVFSILEIKEVYIFA